VGREAELAQLHGWFEKALQGERQLIFVTGEPGIGKTTLVEAFLFGVRSHEGGGVQNANARTPNSELPSTPRPWIGRGQCIEHYGTGEPYLPVLEALGRLCREPDGQRLLEILSQYAPTWLVQMPALLSATELETLQRKVAGATKERMLRELAEAVEGLTAERPLVLWLEDLQWSDVSTLDWLAFVARRREPAQVLVLGTYRPVDVIVGNHPLKGVKHELQLHEQCRELPLGFLRKDDIEAYLARRFVAPAPVSTGEACPEQSRRGRGEGLAPAPLRKLARLIHQRTDGNPLFMVNVIDYLVMQGVLVQREGHWTVAGAVTATDEAGVPASVQGLIERQLERLSTQEQRVLEVASVAGAEFSAAAVAAGLETTVEVVEEQCTELARREQFLCVQGTADWPDGAVATQYGFRHALYQEVLYGRIPASRRQRLHQRIGEREEQAYGERAREMAAELAVHFERGREYRKAIQYLQYAGENATQRSAYGEAIAHFTKGLELLQPLPDTLERTRQELELQLALVHPLIVTKGYAALEVERVYTRALGLCRQLEETPQLSWALLGLSGFSLLRAELKTARELVEQCLSSAQNVHNPIFLVRAHYLLGNILFHLGEFALAREHLEEGIALYDPQQHQPRSYGAEDTRVTCLSYAAVVLWFLGYIDQALQKSHEALTLARDLSQPFSLAIASNFAAALHQHHREVQATQERAEALIVFSTEQEFPHWLAWGTMHRGWALVEQGQGEEGITQIRQGLAAYRATRAELWRPYFLALLAEAYGKVEQVEEGLALLAEALTMVNKSGERSHEAELYRLYGELTLQKEARGWRLEAGSSSPQVSSLKSQVSREVKDEAEGCFLKAIEIARRQSAKSWELRATVSLARLWQQQGKRKQAHKMLAKIYGWFTEGFDTADLKEAKTLLEELTQ
jgi:predicted ATPase